MTINQKEAVDSRRTFAIISHPDAGKTTITEQLLFGAPSAKLEQSKGKTGTLPNLTGWKLKTTGNFGNEFCDAI